MKSFGDLEWGLGQLLNASIIKFGSIEHANQHSIPYAEAIKHHCPNATLVIDRFHVVKALNHAVDEVRKEQWRALDTGGCKAIKGLRWLLSMHARNRTKGHTPFLNNLRNANRRIHRAWVLKDEFEHI